MDYPLRKSSALDWSMSAMAEIIDRLGSFRTRDAERAAALVSEAVWWVTIVDWTMVRYHPETYDQILAAAAEGDRTAIEESLAGLRYARNNMGRRIDDADFVAGPVPQPAQAAATADWTWRALPDPCLSALSPAAREWELDRYRAYQQRLAGHAVDEAFGTAREFLAGVAATAASGVLAR